MDGILDWSSPNWKVCKPPQTMVLSKHQGGNMVKQGANIKLICTYLFNNPGAKPA